MTDLLLLLLIFVVCVKKTNNSYELQNINNNLFYIKLTLEKILKELENKNY